MTEHDRADDDGVVEVVEVVAPLLPVVADALADQRQHQHPGDAAEQRSGVVKRQNGIRAMPAGSEMNVRMIGSMRVKKTVASP